MEQQHALEELHIDWKVDVIAAKWHSNFHAAREFKEAHGGDACDIDTMLTPEYHNEERAEWVEASRWLQRQRELYMKQKLTSQKVTMLKQVLGVKLTRPYGPKRKHRHIELDRKNREFDRAMMGVKSREQQP